MALLARFRSGLVAYAFAFCVVGSLAGTAVLALHSASPFNVLGRLLTEPKTVAEPAVVKAPAATAPAHEATARVNQHVSSLVNSGDLPAFNPFTSIDPAMTFVLNAGAEEASVYLAPDSLLPPIGAFDGDSDAPEFQLAHASGIGGYSGGGVDGPAGGFSSAGGGFYGGGGAVSDVGAGVSDRPDMTAIAGTGVSIDDFRTTAPVAAHRRTAHRRAMVARRRVPHPAHPSRSHRASSLVGRRVRRVRRTLRSRRPSLPDR
jgi:hypothetical protein